MVSLAKSTSPRIPRLQRVKRQLSDGRTRVHWYHRTARVKLPAPNEPGFQEAYALAERLFAEARRGARAVSCPSTVLSSCSAPKTQRGRSHNAPGSQAPDAPGLAHESASAKSGAPHHEMPLYPDENEIALAVLGPRRAREWKAKAIVLERHGLPPIDPLMGGRLWVAVLKFFYDRNNLDGGIAAGVKLPAAGRVRCVPFVPDGREVLDGEEKTAPHSRSK